MTWPVQDCGPSELGVAVSSRRGVRVLAVSGELDLSTRQEWARTLATTLADMSPTCRLVVDLESLRFCDAGCAGLLVDAACHGDTRGRIAVVAPQCIVARILDIVAPSPLLPRYPSVTEAAAMLNATPRRGQGEAQQSRPATRDTRVRHDHRAQATR